MKKRLLAMLMVLSMALSILPMSAMAAPDGDEEAGKKQAEAQISGGTSAEYYTYDGESWSEKGETSPEVKNNEENPKVTVSKQIRPTGTENQFDIALKVEAKEAIETSTKSPDAAVVLVIDVSPSMDYCATCGKTMERYHDRNCKGETSRLDEAKSAAKEFLDTYAASGMERGVSAAKRMVSIVAYHGEAVTKLTWGDVSTAQQLDKAKLVIDSIENGIYFRSSTNIDDGLKRAETNLKSNTINEIDNKFLVLLTDGEPNETTYDKLSEDEGYVLPEGYDMSEYRGTEYQRPAKRAMYIRNQLDTTFYSISFAAGDKVSEWMNSFSNKCVTADNAEELELAFEDVIFRLLLSVDAWKVTDPMGEYIQYQGVENSGQHYTGAIKEKDGTLTWDLRADLMGGATTIVDKNGTPVAKDQYRPGMECTITYNLTYRVSLDVMGMVGDEAVFTDNASAYILTNGPTKLDYYLTQGEQGEDPIYVDDEGKAIASGENPLLTMYFKVPKVRGHVGTLEFTKINAGKQLLSGAEFTLEVSNGDWKETATSSDDGRISFTNIPSGHTYTLTETEAPEGYVAVEPIGVTVSYGEVTATGITDGTLIDPVATGSLAISKTVTEEDGLTPNPDTQFTFSVQFDSMLNGKYNTETSIQGETEKTSGTLQVTGGQATVTLQADQTITIQGLPAGTTYTVTETEPGDGFTQTAPDGAATGTISADGTKTAAFTNTYEVESASLTGSTALQVKKEIQGKAPETSYEWHENDSFTFTITAVTQDAPMPETEEIVISKDTTNHTASFGDITYTKPGTYKYEIREKNSEIPGMSSDSRAYQVQVVVQDTGIGSLNVEKIMYSLLAGGSTTEYKYNENNPMTFVNTYDTATQQVIIRGTKTLTGDTLAKDQFSFALTKAEKVGSEGATVPLPVIDENSLEVGNTVKNTEATANNIFFGTITYDVQDAGTYKYYFQEVVPEDKEPGMVYDDEEKVVTVTVTYDEGVLNATVSVDTGDGTAAGESASLTFHNVKKEATLDGDGNAALTVNKTLTGRGWLPTDTFSFTLAANDDETKKAIVEGNVVLNGVQVDDGVMTTTISGGPTLTGSNSIMNAKTSAFAGITFYEEGTYKFLVQETAGEIEDVTYSQAAYTVTVTVTENNDGTLADPVVTVEQINKDNGDSVTDDGATTLQFTNTVAEKGNTKSVTTGEEGADNYDPDGKVAGVGDILTYTIHWVNDAVDGDGNAATATVTVKDTIPKGTEYVNNSAQNATYDGDTKTLTWTIENADPNATGTVSFRVKVTEAAVKNDEDNTIENQATVEVGDNESKQTTKTETYVPEKSVTKYQPKDGDATEVPQTGLKVGEQLTYTISYKNTEDTAAKVTITDKVPTGTEFVSADNGGALDKESGVVTWTLNEVQPGATGEVTMTVKVVSGAETTVENTASVQIGQNGPTVSTNTESTEIDESERTITITPADIIVYTGGTGYESVVGNQSGAARAGDDEETGEQSNGLPEPGYYITLPDWLNDQLNIQEDPTEDGATDLSKILTFTYADDEDQTREWSLALYYDGEDGTSYEETTVEGVTRNRYVYRMNPAVVDGEKIPVRVQFVPKDDPDGIPTLSDDFTLDLGTLYQQYSMTIYPGLLNENLVRAEVKVDGASDTKTLPVKVGNGTLTVRGTTNGEVTTKVATTTDAVAENEKTIDDATGCTITAVADADTQYVINDSHVTVEAENVHLLVDELSQGDTAEGDAANESQQILKNYLVKNNQAETDDHYIYQYLDLVDETNGRAWVTADQPVDVYWKLPKGSDSNDDFKIVHFTGLDRQYDEETENLIGTEGYEVEEYTTANNKLEIVTLDGEQYLKFATKEFSPFVLVWDEVSNSSGGGGGGGNKPSLNTEDHYGYIVGYPVDYATGEPTDDQARKPVKPQGKITRAEVATIFFRMLTDESRNEYWSQSNDFTDVMSDAWYNNAISTMANAGILDGYEDGSFHPNGYITRAEFATSAVRFFDLSYQGEDLFPDIDGHWAQDYINQAADAGIIEGYPDGTFGPQKQITRAEAVTMVNRTLDRHPDPDHFLEDMLVWPDNLDTEAWYYADMQEATNSHEYQMKKDAQGNEYEVWTKILPIRDWEALEKEWSDANSSENPGNVAG